MTPRLKDVHSIPPSESPAAVPGTVGAPQEQPPRRSIAGLLVRKESWRLSLAGKLLVLIAFVGLAFGLQRTIYPFLAITNRVPANYMVVEGWLQASSLKQ